MPKDYPYYLLWSGSTAVGDTVGVFDDAAYAGLLLQIPFTVTYIDEKQEVVKLVLVTTEVEIYNDPTTGDPLNHPVYLDWEPGTAFPKPVGTIDADTIFDGRPEFHLLTLPAEALRATNKHSITIQVNPKAGAGFRDDFVLKRIDVDEAIGAKIGW